MAAQIPITQQLLPPFDNDGQVEQSESTLHEDGHELAEPPEEDDEEEDDPPELLPEEDPPPDPLLDPPADPLEPPLGASSKRAVVPPVLFRSGAGVVPHAKMIPKATKPTGALKCGDKPMGTFPSPTRRRVTLYKK